MAKPDLDRLCRAYRAYRTAGYAMPEAWRLANEHITDQPKKAKK